VLNALCAAGAEVAVTEDRIAIRSPRNGLRSVDIIATPYPGVPTDVQAQWTALISIAEGTSKVRDCVFFHRFHHVAELNRMGARVACEGDTAIVRGVGGLSGARVTASDLRASAALVLAGLAAESRTIVEQIHHLDRGYDRLDDTLRQLGAVIERTLTHHPKVSIVGT
jgi:UDP-N-acetylglucosamine 1-carboxyvinyltransferase